MSEKELKEIFSANLRRLLDEHDKSQADLRRYMGVSSATASDWCNGKKIPRADKLQAICIWLNCEMSDLLGEYKNTDVRTDGQESGYYDEELVKDITEQLRQNPEYGVMFKALTNVKPEDIELVTKFIEKMS